MFPNYFNKYFRRISFRFRAFFLHLQQRCIYERKIFSTASRFLWLLCLYVVRSALHGSTISCYFWCAGRIGLADQPLGRNHPNCRQHLDCELVADPQLFQAPPAFHCYQHRSGRLCAAHCQSVCSPRMGANYGSARRCCHCYRTLD